MQRHGVMCIFAELMQWDHGKPDRTPSHEPLRHSWCTSTHVHMAEKLEKLVGHCSTRDRFGLQYQQLPQQQTSLTL